MHSGVSEVSPVGAFIGQDYAGSIVTFTAERSVDGGRAYTVTWHLDDLVVEISRTNGLRAPSPLSAAPYALVQARLVAQACQRAGCEEPVEASLDLDSSTALEHGTVSATLIFPEGNDWEVRTTETLFAESFLAGAGTVSTDARADTSVSID